MLTPTVVVLGTEEPAMAGLLPDTAPVYAADARALAEALTGLKGDVVLVDPDIGCSAGYPVDDLCRPGRSAVLIGADGAAPVRVAGSVVVSAGTSAAPLVDASASAAGCLQVAAADLPALREAVEQVPVGPAGRLWEQILSLLVMQAVAIKPVDVTPFALGRAPVAAATDPVALQARRCARGGDGWVSERTVRRMSRAVTPIAVRWGLAPNTITVVSLLLGAGAVVAALTGSRWGYLLTGLLMVASLVLDCVDGEVARWTHRYSKAGAWLDAVGDRVKEYSVWFAVGWAVAVDRFWVLVLSCLVLFTTKHFLDYGWSLRTPPWRPRAVAVSAQPDPWQRDGAIPPAVRPPSWRRILGMPIAERWLLVAVLLPLTGAWVTFTVLAVLGAGSLAYTVLTRIRWSHYRISEQTAPQLQAITDPGPLLLALRPHRVGSAAAAALGLAVMLTAAGLTAGRGWVLLVGYAVALGLFALAYGPGPRGRLGWMSPAVARSTEMVVLIAVAWTADTASWVAVFALLAASAWRHYDVIYRIRHQQVLPGRAGWLALLGTEGRVLLAIVIALAVGLGGWSWLAVYLAVVAVADSLWSWFGTRPQ